MAELVADRVHHERVGSVDPGIGPADAGEAAIGDAGPGNAGRAYIGKHHQDAVVQVEGVIGARGIAGVGVQPGIVAGERVRGSGARHPVHLRRHGVGDRRVPVADRLEKRSTRLRHRLRRRQRNRLAREVAEIHSDHQQLLGPHGVRDRRVGGPRWLRRFGCRLTKELHARAGRFLSGDRPGFEAFHFHAMDPAHLTLERDDFDPLRFFLGGGDRGVRDLPASHASRGQPGRHGFSRFEQPNRAFVQREVAVERDAMQRRAFLGRLRLPPSIGPSRKRLPLKRHDPLEGRNARGFAGRRRRRLERKFTASGMPGFQFGQHGGGERLSNRRRHRHPQRLGRVRPDQPLHLRATRPGQSNSVRDQGCAGSEVGRAINRRPRAKRLHGCR